MKADARAVSRFVGTNWPRAVAALKEVDTFLKDHPGVPTWLRGRFDDIRRRVEAVQRRRGDAAKIRAMLDIVRMEAPELDAQGAHPSTIDAASWVRRADNIERRVRLAEVLDQPEQKKALGRLRAEADALVGDLIDATANLPVALAEAEDEPPTP